MHFLASIGLLKVILLGLVVDDTYCPNTITYCFREIIEQDVIIAPHTVYVAEHDLRDAIASPMIDCPDDTSRVKFVKPNCQQLDEDFDEIVAFARQMSYVGRLRE